MELKQVNCICNSGNHKIILKKNGFNIVRCNECGHVYVNPRLRFSTLFKMYNSDEISSSKDHIRTRKEDIQTFKSRLKFIEEYLHINNDIGLLDIGCATGSLLEIAEKKGWKAIGIDLNKSSIRECRKKNFDTVCSSFEDFVSNKKFDVIVMNDFIEHTENPKQALSKANFYLNEGGILFITTPDIGSLIAKLTRAKWLHLKPNEHLHYFTKKNIIRILNETGFKVLKIKSAKRKRSLRVIIWKLETYSRAVSKFLNKIIPKFMLENIYFNVNPFDEMMVIARK